MMSVPCNVHLTQTRYEYMIVDQTQTIRGSTGLRSTIHYSLIRAWLYEFAKVRPGQACVTGEVRVRILGQFENKVSGPVIPEASYIQTGWRDQSAAQQCLSHRLTILPVYIDWAPTLQHITRSQFVTPEVLQATVNLNAVTKSAELLQCVDCSGHACALVVDNQHRTVQFWDPNGSAQPYFVRASEWIQRNIPAPLNQYSYVPDLQVPYFGYQAGTELAMCAYFSALYLALRIDCGQFTAQQINDSLREIDRGDILNVLSHFHCLVLDQCFRSGLLVAYNALPQLYEEAFGVVLNAPAAQEGELRQRMREADFIVTWDLLGATQSFRHPSSPLPHW
jgi:hypothetical protein